MQLPCIVDMSTLVNYSGISDRMANSGLNDMRAVMFTSSSECFQSNVTVQTDEECLRIKLNVNFFQLSDNNTDSSYWFPCISHIMGKKNLITNQITDLLLYSSLDYCIDITCSSMLGLVTATYLAFYQVW